MSKLTWEAERVMLELTSVGDPWPAGLTSAQLTAARFVGLADLKRAGWTIKIEPPQSAEKAKER